MTSTVLSFRELPALQPAHLLQALYQPETAPYRFSAQTPQAALDWQQATRSALRETLGFASLPEVDPDPQLIESVDRGDYIREKILIRTTPWSVMPFYYLRPKGHNEPLPVVLALHGHGYGVKDIVGLWEDGSERDAPDGYHKDFAVALCRRGFAVAAPEISSFGERRSDFSTLNAEFGQEAPYPCHHTATLAFALGGSALGLRVLDAARLVDYLSMRADLDLNRLGAMGISGGGMHTFYSTALDPRIRACVVSGYYCSYRRSIYAMHHCTCNYVPGLAKFGEIYDLVGLIAPRPMLIEAGTRDPIFPLDGVQEALERGRAVYSTFGAPATILADTFEGRHQISGRLAYNFLWEALQPAPLSEASGA